MTNSAIKRSLLKSLNAYVKHFETPNTREDLLAITSSILTFQQKQRSLTITFNRSEALIQQVVNLFEVESAVNCFVDSETEKLVKEVHQWRRSLEGQILISLNAYVQNFHCNQKMNLPEIILSIIPLVEDIQLHKSESESLIQRVISKFDFQINIDSDSQILLVNQTTSRPNVIQFSPRTFKSADEKDKQIDNEIEVLRKLLQEKRKLNQPQS
ncbi:hypothetical protein [Pseudanabaena sp. SR411]|uniref:hypothetical protein n=1 Tax=Pseudanabaena sp. SR411 TaxID=1980935 RepID=UPI000B9936A7|nr:hypothetical protein [Pseudanabaena sp. SR411]